jgi:hypothetical protein
MAGLEQILQSGGEPPGLIILQINDGFGYQKNRMMNKEA